MASPSVLAPPISPVSVPKFAVDRRLQAVRALSCEPPCTPHSGSPALGHTGSPNLPGSAGRRPLFPLPPPIVSPFGSSSFGDASDDELLINDGRQRYALKRERSFHGRRSSLLARQLSSGSLGAQSPFATSFGAQSPFSNRTAWPPPPPPLDISDAPASAALALAASAIRPPPIRTMASLEGWCADGGEHASVPSIRSGSTDGNFMFGVASAPNLLISTGETSPSASAAAPPPAPPPTPSGRHGGRRFGRHGFDPTPPMSLVAPGLYVGDESAASDLPALLAAGVTHVLNCTGLQSALEGLAGAPTFMQLGLLDNTSDLPRMQEALGTGVEFISRAHAGGGCVLVHCHRGISRSATLAIAYLVRQTQTPAEQVFELMRPKRRVIDPNLGYWVSLKEWERRVLPPSVLRAHAPRRHNSPTPLVGAGVRPLSRAG